MSTKPVPLMALDLFLAGNDTTDIARILGVTEAEAYNRLARSRELSRRRETRRERRLRWVKNPGKNAAGKFLYAGAE